MKGKSHSQSGAAFLWLLIGLLAVGGIAVALWVWIMSSWSYSSGERAGWVQKLSLKGYVCKTWEGEMAMVSLPGSVPEKFFFTVRDENAAKKINDLIGRRVSLYYEEHILLPGSCFGETRHFVKSVKLIESTSAPMQIPGDAPAPLPLQSNPGPTAPGDQAAPPRPAQ